MRAAPFLTVGALAAFGTEELYRYVFCREQGRLLPPLLDKKNHAADYYLNRERAEAAVRARPALRCTILSARSEELVGHYFMAGDEPSGKIAFIVHGYRSNYAETAGIHFDYYTSKGFDIFACDHTAHGESGGRFIGYSAFESEDCLRWLDHLITRFGSSVKIVLHGYSMGGATVLNMSDRIPDNVRFIVEDSGFDCAAGILKSSLGPMYAPLRMINRLVAGYDAERDTEVYPRLKKAKAPILFVHGKEDNMVPWANGRHMYEACTVEKDCLFTDGVAHIETMLRAPEAYKEKLDDYINRFI